MSLLNINFCVKIEIRKPEEEESLSLAENMTLLPDLETNCEILWAEVQISASKSLTLGCFYRPPDSKISTSEDFVKSLDLMPKNSNQTIVLGGDFNLPGIDWDNGVVNPKAANKSQGELLLSSLDTHGQTLYRKDTKRRGGRYRS